MELKELEEKISGQKCRVILVYNPRSSKAKRVTEEVIDPIRKIPGIMVGKYEVKPTDVDDNARSLAKILLDNDIVITAGGDGTATIGLNGTMLSGKDVRFMALPYGNFNDMARTLKHASGKELYPLEAKIDGVHYRYAACYFTIGMFAESTEIFDSEKTRKKLQKGDKGIFFSLRTLIRWYFKNKRKVFIPPFKYSSTTRTYDKNGVFQTRVKILNTDETKGISDYLAINGLSVAKMMKGGKEFYSSKTDFLSTTGRLNKIFRLATFMRKSVFRRIPADITTEDVITFPDYGDIEIQAEGEYKRLNHVGKIVIGKAEKSIKIL
ncbi:acylglycerol kinase family protein [Candidatus Saccharibacteria bacterium]|nr:acylglycerol kinase family protein [Candidatus Saccharibacteria bacterium]